jgi:hypothetical protein
MHPMLYTLRDVVYGQLQRAREQPVNLLVRPGIKAVVIIGLLTVAAQVAQQSPSERKILAKNATGFKASKAPVTTGSAKR